MRINLKERLRRESSAQYSGKVYLRTIPKLKERNYYIVDVPLDGDAPKQYIKAYFYYKNCPRQSKPEKWDGFFCKFGGKSYPHESVVEYLINKIGDYLDLNMNETRLVIANDQIRFLSKDFLKDGQRLIHGVEILAEYFEDRNFIDEINKDRKNRRAFLTFNEVESAIKHVYKSRASHLLKDLIKLIAYDAIVGNNDRHFYNWGVIGTIVKSKGTPVVFSPIFDTARALLWNHTDIAVQRMRIRSSTDPKVVENYINKSKPRFSYPDKIDANHFELISFLARYNHQYYSVIEDLTTKNREDYVINKLNQNTKLLFCQDRCIMMEAILRNRFIKLRNSLL